MVADLVDVADHEAQSLAVDEEAPTTPVLGGATRKTITGMVRGVVESEAAAAGDDEAAPQNILPAPRRRITGMVRAMIADLVDVAEHEAQSLAAAEAWTPAAPEPPGAEDEDVLHRIARGPRKTINSMVRAHAGDVEADRPADDSPATPQVVDASVRLQIRDMVPSA